MPLLSLILKNKEGIKEFLIFFPKKSFSENEALTVWEMELLSPTLNKRKISYISGNENF